MAITFEMKEQLVAALSETRAGDHKLYKYKEAARPANALELISSPLEDDERTLRSFKQDAIVALKRYNDIRTALSSNRTAAIAPILEKRLNNVVPEVFAALTIVAQFSGKNASNNEPLEKLCNAALGELRPQRSIA